MGFGWGEGYLGPRRGFPGNGRFFDILDVLRRDGGQGGSAS
jgi:hypothetical protein